MEPDQAVADLEQFLAERGDHLLRTAVLLTGNKEAGEDLLQAALERLLYRWPTIEGNPEGYLRRTLYHLAVGELMDGMFEAVRRCLIPAVACGAPHMCIFGSIVRIDVDKLAYLN